MLIESINAPREGSPGRWGACSPPGVVLLRGVTIWDPLLQSSWGLDSVQQGAMGSCDSRVPGASQSPMFLCTGTRLLLGKLDYNKFLIFWQE